MKKKRSAKTIIQTLDNKKLLCAAGFFSVAQSLVSVCIAFLLEGLVNTASQGDMSQLGRVFLIIGIYLVVAFVIVKLDSVLSNRYVASQNTVLREYLVDQLFRKSIGDYQKIGMGKTLAMLENDVSLIEKHYFRARLKLISLCSTFLFGLISMFVINWRIAFVVIFTSMLPVLFSSIYSKPLGHLQNAYSDSYSNYMTALKNILSNYSLIKVFHIENKVQSDVSEQCRKQEQSKKQYLSRLNLVEGYTSLMGFVVIIAVFGVGTLLIIQGTAQIGALLAFIQLTNYVLSPIEGISLQLGNIRSCQAIINRFNSFAQIQGETPNIEFPEQPSLSLKNVSYRYGEKDALKNITMTLECGKRYVIVGSNGSGKSTLLRIINRFYEDYTGELYYGDTEARQLEVTSFYKNVIMLQQDVLILKDTIKNNILLYDHTIDENALSPLLKSLQLDTLYNRTSLCLDNGDDLSGGEKQRIAAARALIRHPYILLLDESFSALDPASREMVETVLLPSAQIVVAISHDRTLENLRKYDEVIYLDSGNLIAKGPVDEMAKLLNLSGSAS